MLAAETPSAWLYLVGMAFARKQAEESGKPLLFLDVDGVISLFGFDDASVPRGRFHFVDGIAHFIGADCADLIEQLREQYELVWATGWEEKANEYLPFLLELPDLVLPVLTFDGRAVFGSAHWKIDVIDHHAGDRPAAWVDDNLDTECEQWAADRPAPTLLVRTSSREGLTETHIATLLEWAAELERSPTR